MLQTDEIISRILYLMDESPLKKSQILRKLNLSTSTLSDWERGKGNPSASAVVKLAEYFHVSTDYILLGKRTDLDDSFSEKEQKWLKLHDLLSEREQELCSAYIRGLIESRKEEK